MCGNSKLYSVHFSTVVACLFAFVPASLHAQAQQFVSRSADKLIVEGRPYYFLGANAYYLLETAAVGDTAGVEALFSAAQSLGLTVIRTWGFFDSSDSLNPAVIQYRPGAFNEHALRALDFVVYQAGKHNIRLLMPLVNSWDDYGGMNQYVRWRVEYPTVKHTTGSLYEGRQVEHAIVTGQRGQSYRVQINPLFGHDDFYSDPVIVNWYKAYVAMILQRTNTYTGVQWKDDPTVLGWELVNEPRSSDRTGRVVAGWVGALSAFTKSIDVHHLVGTGEEGFDNTSDGYSTDAYAGQTWMFNGSIGVSFSMDSAVPGIDMASVHLYPESWNLSNSAGNPWIRDHVQIARSIGKPLVVGEFGVRSFRMPTYASWMTTMLLEGAAGGLVWQLLEGPRTDPQGFGFTCPDDTSSCAVVRTYASEFNGKTGSGSIPLPSAYMLYQNFPNPFNGITTIAYDLPVESSVKLRLYDILGRWVATLVDEMQQAGPRLELLDATGLASGAYFYRLVVTPAVSGNGPAYTQTRKVLLIR